MPNGPKERFSDLDAARAASRSLRASGAQRPVDRGYVRFDVSRFAGAPAPAPAAPTSPLPMRARGGRFGASNWELLLDDCMVATEAHVAFLMNEQGLVIAARGGIDPDEAEAVGARTQLALEQADRMATGASARRTVIVELDDRWLVGLRFQLAEDTSITLCLLGREPPDAARRAAIGRLVDAAVLGEGQRGTDTIDGPDAPTPPSLTNNDEA